MHAEKFGKDQISHWTSNRGARQDERSGSEVDQKWTGSGPGLDHFGPLLDRPHFRSTSVHFRNTPPSPVGSLDSAHSVRTLDTHISK